MKPNLKNIQLWVDELRTTDKKQGTMFLCKNDNYCCLGVATEQYQKLKNHPMDEYTEGDGSKVYRSKKGIPYRGSLPTEVANWLGIESNPKNMKGIYYFELNDRLQHRYTFKQIADELEKQYLTPIELKTNTFRK